MVEDTDSLTMQLVQEMHPGAFLEKTVKYVQITFWDCKKR